MAAGLQLGGSESYPGVFQPYGGFADAIPIVDGYTTPARDARHRHGAGAKMMDEMRKRLELE